MSEELFDLVFSGQLAPGAELAQAKKNIQTLFRIDESKVEILFSGKTVTLKKSLTLDVGTKYRVAMKKAGVQANLVESQTDPAIKEAPKDAVKPSAEPKATQAPAQSSSQSKPAPPATNVSDGDWSSDLGAQPVKTEVPREEIHAPDFGLSAEGEDLLREDEKTHQDAADIDVSAMSVAPQEGNLVDPEELELPAFVEITIPEVDLAPVGESLLKDGERKKVEPVNVDVSNLSVSEVGGKLSPDAPEPPPAPDVSHISLEE